MSRYLAVVLLTGGLLWLVACQSPAPTSEGDDGETAAGEQLTSTDEFRASAGDFGPRDQMPGADLYARHCANCHDGTVPKAPHLIWLELMSARSILTSLNEGVMKAQAAALSEAERRHIAEYLSMEPVDRAATTDERVTSCGEDARLDMNEPPARAGWGYDTARYYDEAIAGMTGETAPKLKLAWAFAYPGAQRARSQPVVGYGAVYVGSQDGTVYALDLNTGCAHWSFKASAEVRTGVVLAERENDPPLAIFGDILARVYAVDATSGQLVWSRKADDHPSATLTGTPALHRDLVFVPVSSLEVTAAADPNYPCCSFRGHVLALDVATGEMVWDHYTIPEPPRQVAETSVGTPVLSPSGAPTWTSPAVDAQRNRIYIGTGENYSSPADGNSDAVIAIDIESGERVWQRQAVAGDAWNVACMMADNPNCPEEDGPDFDIGSSMILVDLTDGRQILAVGQKDGRVMALDPDNDGALLWSTRVGRGSIQGGVHFGMAAAGATIFAPVNDMNELYDGSVVDSATARPGVHALDAATGEVIWSHVQADVCELKYCDPGVSAAISAIPGAVVAGHLDGYLRIYAQTDGSVLWEYDTKQPVPAVNGGVARGGGMSGSGPAIVDGRLIVNSGYGLYFHEAGNMLAVFAVE